MGELPNQLESNLMVLERLQQQLSDQQRNLRDEKNRLISIDNQLQLAKADSTAKVTASAFTEVDEATTLDVLKQQLAEYKTRYTPKHPDVIMLQKKIEGLEKQMPATTSSADRGTLNQIEDNTSRQTIPSGAEADLMMQRNNTIIEISAIKEEISDLQKQILLYQRRVENTPKLEQELLALNRDYDNTQKTYESLLARKQEAEVAANMERQQKGEQFRILDPARLPDKPTFPDMRKLFLMCIMAGLALGCGLIFVLEYFDRSIKKLETVPTKLGIPILVTMPSVEQPKDIRKRRINDGLSLLAALACLALFALLAAVSIRNMPGPTEFVKNVISSVVGGLKALI
jgi:uncharacterized protein involved in exopolysaccharide biosynthesis